MAVKIILNGTSVAPDAHADTISALLASRSIDPTHVVVEINREIVDRDRFGAVVLRNGDEVEILRFVGGG